MGILSFITKEETITSLQDLELAKGKIQLTIMKMAAFILGLIMVAVVFTMMVGLFVPNTVIDNNEIFKIIGPAFSTIVGAFVGAFATMMGMKTAEFDPNVKVLELGKTDHKALAESHVINAQAESIEVDNEIKMMAAVDKYLDSDEDHGPF
jgi:cytochrome c biogenesis protein CcdA